MKSKFSAHWNSSVQPRKQRKFRYNAPLHVRHRFLSANLSKELREKYGKRNLPLRKDDEVSIMRGKFAKKKGKILVINLKKSKVTIDGVNRKKSDGTKVNVYLNPSNLQIIKLNLEDRKRIKGMKEEKVENKVGGKNNENKESSSISTSKSGGGS
jgi:large subunit ribosomal protein L24